MIEIGDKLKLIGKAKTQYRKLGSISTVKFIDDKGFILIKHDEAPHANLRLHPYNPLKNCLVACGARRVFVKIEEKGCG